jgi:hypothetical protein
VERFFAEITQRRIRRGTFTQVRELEQAIRDYVQEHNRKPKPLVWTATANTILNKIKRSCERTSVTEHLAAQLTYIMRRPMGLYNIEQSMWLPRHLAG